MQGREVEAIDFCGQSVRAKLLECEECGRREFYIYVLEGGHEHLQCVGCGVSYCSGSCAEI